MKKLLVLASSLAMACAVNAASCTWGFGSDSILDKNGDYVGEQIAATAFLYLGTVATTGSTYDLSGATLLTYGAQNADFTFGSPSTPVSISGLQSDAANQAYTLILAEGDLTSLDGYTGNMIVVTGTGGRAVDPMSGDSWATFVNGTAYPADAWANLAPAPEPTSGLLMLLGLAGLALKRKCA